MRHKLDRAAIKNLARNPRGMVGDYLRKVGAKLRILAAAQAGVKTGLTRAMMNYKLTSSGRGLAVLVGSDSRVALMHHEGTSPHTILPRHAKTLRFYSHGRIVYAKVVHHPGTKPNRYLTDNLRKVI